MLAGRLIVGLGIGKVMFIVGLDLDIWAVDQIMNRHPVT